MNQLSRGGLLSLFRPKLAVVNGIAAGGGYLLFPFAQVSAPLWRVMAGVTLLAAAGSAANQVLEQDLDRLMDRTKSRPLPQGTITPATAVVMACALLVAGLLLLSPQGLLPMLLGGAALAWYLGVYTPLKRRSPFALLAGGICGAMGPVIGWCGAGGSASDYRVILLAGLLYLWQIPHFWLFQHRHQDDYRLAGLPIFDPRTPGSSPTAFCRLWIIALMAGSFMLPLFGLIAPGLLPWYSTALLFLGTLSLVGPQRSRLAALNLFPLLVPLTLFIQGR